MTDFVLQGSTPVAPHITSFEHPLQPAEILSINPTTARFRSVQRQPNLEEPLAAAGLDGHYVPSARPWNNLKLLVMDMDSTLITIECIDEIADFAGVKPGVAAITEAAMRGELDFKEALRRRVQLLAGLPVGVLERVYNERLQLSPGAETLLARAKEASIQTLLVSGGFTYFTKRLQERLGLNETLANDLEIQDGHLTGRVTGPIVDGERKAETLATTAARLGLNSHQVLAVGDGANDLPMMRRAGVSIAYHAKPVVRKEATHALNWVGLDGIPHLFS